MTNRIGFIKPDYGFRGGFEVLIEQLAHGLRDRGHKVEMVSVDATTQTETLYGLPMHGSFHQWHNEFFSYLTVAERTQRLALDDFDTVVATQPPTWHARHENLIGLFFHQGRVFYDLREEFVQSQFVDPIVHEAAVQGVRALDASAVGNVELWLAGSQTSADRLSEFWDILPDSILPYRHPVLATDQLPQAPNDSTSIALVSRHEWPKRTELPIAAMHQTTLATTLDSVGTGTRLTFAKDLDARLSFPADGSTSVEDLDRMLWLNAGAAAPGWTPSAHSERGHTMFHGSLSDKERDAVLSRAAAVVAPAYAEDYGLTALEAFARKKPLIVCQDGGGLTEFIVHEQTGLVVDPTPTALATAMDRLVGDPQFASELASAGHEHGRTFTLDRALDQFEAALG